MLLLEVRVGELDELVLVLADDGLATRALDPGLHVHVTGLRHTFRDAGARPYDVPVGEVRSSTEQTGAPSV